MHSSIFVLNHCAVLCQHYNDITKRDNVIMYKVNISDKESYLLLYIYNLGKTKLHLEYIDSKLTHEK